MAGVVGLFFGQTEGQKIAKKALRDSEDRTMQVSASEKAECPIHSAADENRHGFIIAYMRDLHESIEAGNNRLMVLLGLVGFILFVKGGATWKDIFDAIAAHI